MFNANLAKQILEEKDGLVVEIENKIKQRKIEKQKLKKEYMKRKAEKRRMKFIQMATDNKSFTEGYFEGQSAIGSPRKHQFREESPSKRISDQVFKNYPIKHKSIIQRQTSSVAWEEESSVCSLRKQRSV